MPIGQQDFDSHGLDPATVGAVGDGVADDTAAWQRVVAMAKDGQWISLRGRTYRVRDIALCPGLGGIIGPGKLVGAADIDGGLIHCGRQPGDHRPPIQNVVLRDIAIETGGARCGIEFVGVENGAIENCRIVVDRDLQKGIWLRDSCRGNTLRGNRVKVLAHDPLRSVVCVTIESRAPDGCGAYFEGNGRVTYIDSSWGNVVEGNMIEGGTHGVAVGHSSRNRIINNLITGNGHRNINICPASRFNIVSHNQLLDAGSSAVAMAYGTCDNIVTDNQIASWNTIADADRDAIHAYVACHGNRIAGNVIMGNFRYGVYLAVGARRNRVHDNQIRLEPNSRVANDWNTAIALETDWLERPLPQNARFSRENFGSAPEPFPWAFEDSEDNVIRDNLIEKATCGVYLAQIGCRALRLNRIESNRCMPDVELALFVHAPEPRLFSQNGLVLDQENGAATIASSQA